MKKWKYSIDIKQHLSSDTSNEAIVKAAQGVVQELNKLPSALEGGLEEHLYEFEDLAADCITGEDNDELLSHFNYLLNDLYNFADDNRIWMGI